MSKHTGSIVMVTAIAGCFSLYSAAYDSPTSGTAFVDKEVRIEFQAARHSMRHTQTRKVSFDKPVKHVWAVVEEVRVQYTEGERAFYGTSWGVNATVRPGDLHTVEVEGSLGLYDRSSPGDDLITGELRIRVHAVTN